MKNPKITEHQKKETKGSAYHGTNDAASQRELSIPPPVSPLQLKKTNAPSEQNKNEEFKEDRHQSQVDVPFSLPPEEPVKSRSTNANKMAYPAQLKSSNQPIQFTIQNNYSAGTGKSAKKINKYITEYNQPSQQVVKTGDSKNNSPDEAKINKLHQLEKLRKLVSQNLKEKTKDAKPSKLKSLTGKFTSSSDSDTKRDQLKALQIEINNELRTIGGQLFSGSTIDHIGDLDAKKKSELGRGIKHMYKQLYLKKGQQGRLMSDQEITQLKEIAQNQNLGTTFLQNDLKTGSYVDAISYINGKNYKNWLQIHPNKRMLVTSLIYNSVKNSANSDIKLPVDELKITPAFAMALSLSGNKDEIKAHTAKNWEKTMGSNSKLSDKAKSELNPNNDADRAKQLESYERKNDNGIKILKKVFLLLHAGLKENTDGAGYKDWTENVSTALSHGGRVNIKIPKLTKGGDPNELLNWLGITKDGKKNKEAGVVKRSFGTHHMEINDKKGTFKEKGGKGAALKNKLGSTKIFGLDLAAGGFGNIDFNGDYILPDGANGHMFIGFKPPTKKNSGALEIGIETTGPGAHSNVGYVHNWNSTEATANPLSSVGGAKSDKHGHGKLDWGRIDLNDLRIPFTDQIGGWLGKLQELEVMYEESKARGDVNDALLVGKR